MRLCRRGDEMTEHLLDCLSEMIGGEKGDNYVTNRRRGKKNKQKNVLPTASEMIFEFMSMF